jgi:hypothetical protein
MVKCEKSEQEQVDVLKERSFSRPVNPAKSTLALAPEGRILWSELHLQQALELGVAPVAENRIGCVLAAAEVNGFGFGGVELHRCKTASLVASVAEGLTCAPAAGTPVIALAGFDFDGKGTLLGNRRFWHRGILLETV